MKPSAWNRFALGGGVGLPGCVPIAPGGRGTFDDGIACAICGRGCGADAAGGRGGGAGARTVGIGGIGATATAGGFAGASGTGATGRMSSSRIIGAEGVGDSIEVSGDAGDVTGAARAGPGSMVRPAMPGRSAFGRPWCAAVMKRLQMSAGMAPPVSFLVDELSSLPSQTPATRWPV